MGHGVLGTIDQYNDQWNFVKRPDFEDLEAYQLAENPLPCNSSHIISPQLSCLSAATRCRGIIVVS